MDSVENPTEAELQKQRAEEYMPLGCLELGPVWKKPEGDSLRERPTTATAMLAIPNRTAARF
jgi:hypothetical protein